METNEGLQMLKLAQTHWNRYISPHVLNSYTLSICPRCKNTSLMVMIASMKKCEDHHRVILSSNVGKKKGRRSTAASGKRHPSGTAHHHTTKGSHSTNSRSLSLLLHLLYSVCSIIMLTWAECVTLKPWTCSDLFLCPCNAAVSLLPVINHLHVPCWIVPWCWTVSCFWCVCVYY